MIFCHSQIEAVGDLTQSLPLPLKGEGLGIACLGLVGLALPVHNRGTLAQQGWGFGGVRFPTWPSKPHTGPHRGEFGFHRFFLVRFWLGRAAKPSDRMHSCIRFSIPVLGSPILYFRHRKF